MSRELLIEKMARGICRARFLRVGGENAQAALALDPAEFDRIVVDPGWRVFVSEASAVLSLLADPANISDETCIAATAAIGLQNIPHDYVRRLIAAAFAKERLTGERKP